MTGCGRILDSAAEIGAGIARALAYAPRDPEATIYGSWKNAFVGGSYEFLRDGARLLDARTQFHYIATVITPAMAHAQVGAGSAYAYTVQDANGDPLDGAKTYRLHVDPDPPAKNFWSVDVYDTQTRSLLQVPSTIYPALASNTGTLRANARRLLRPLVRAQRARGPGVQLDRDAPRQVVVPDLPPLRPARAVVRPDLEAQRVRTPRRMNTANFPFRLPALASRVRPGPLVSMHLSARDRPSCPPAALSLSLEAAQRRLSRVLESSRGSSGRLAR